MGMMRDDNVSRRQPYDKGRAEAQAFGRILVRNRPERGRLNLPVVHLQAGKLRIWDPIADKAIPCKPATLAGINDDTKRGQGLAKAPVFTDVHALNAFLARLVEAGDQQSMLLASRLILERGRSQAHGFFTLTEAYERNYFLPADLDASVHANWVAAAGLENEPGAEAYGLGGRFAGQANKMRPEYFSPAPGRARRRLADLWHGFTREDSVTRLFPCQSQDAARPEHLRRADLMWAIALNHCLDPFPEPERRQLPLDVIVAGGAA